MRDSSHRGMPDEAKREGILNDNIQAGTWEDIGRRPRFP